MLLPCRHQSLLDPCVWFYYRTTKTGSSLLGCCKQKQRGFRRLLCRWPSITEWEMHNAHHCSAPPVSEITYTVSSGTLNATIPYHTGSDTGSVTLTRDPTWPCQNRRLGDPWLEDPVPTLPQRMLFFLRRQPANLCLPGKWPLKRYVCITRLPKIVIVNYQPFYSRYFNIIDVFFLHFLMFFLIILIIDARFLWRAQFWVAAFLSTLQLLVAATLSWW